MALSPTVEKVLRQVEKATGLPVHVEPDSTLPKNILAKVTMARGGIPFHQVAYQSASSAAPDYLIVFQCGFILRRFAVSIGDRYDLAQAPHAEETVRGWVTKNPKQPNPALHQAEGLIGFLFNNLLSQLRSVPVGLRIDDWILKSFPELRPLQEEALTKQLNDNAAALKPDVQKIIPEQALATNLTMSAAYAIFWADRLGQTQITLPYKASGYMEKGQELFDLWRDTPSDPAHDKSLIDRWAEKLSLQGWYTWVKAES
jgi:hypothetical protein